MLTFNILKFLPVLYCCFHSTICDYIYEDFVRPDFCTDMVLKSLESYSSLEAGSAIQCAAICSLDNNCLSVSFMIKDRTCFLNFGLLADDCGNGVMLSDSVYYKKKHAIKKCINNGTLVNNDCVCYGGYIGSYCERLMTDCSEGFREMYKDGSLGLYEVLPLGAPQSFNVMCRMQWGGRSIIMQHFNTAYTLNRTWVQYRDGFDHGSAATWIGLEKLYWLSRSKTLDLHISFQKKKLPPEFVKIVYEKFEIGNSSTNYKLLSAQINYAISPANVTDCLSDLIGSSFSSYDMNNNQVSGLNCSQKYGGGWWYNGACAQCNPNGKLYGFSSGGVRTWADDEAFWESFDWSPVGVSCWLEN